MKHTWRCRLLAFCLVICTLFGLGLPAHASSIMDGSKTASVVIAPVHTFLQTRSGYFLHGSGYTYTTNDGLSGPAYCINHGLSYTTKTLPIEGKYTTSFATAGAFASGYPQHSLETFLFRHLAENPIIADLTEDEYRYATQIAVWATLGQIGIEGTAFTEGHEYIDKPTNGDLQQLRVFAAVELILDTARRWTNIPEAGMYIRLEKDVLGGNTAIPPNMTLEFAANENRYGIKCEVINGVSYYTKEYIFASATSTYYSDYNIEVWADNAPAGTIFTDLNNVELARGNFREQSTWKLPTDAYYDITNAINDHLFEYRGTAKLCIPVNTAPNSGEITINCGAYVMQYMIYLAYNESATEQSYIIADPSKGTLTADAVLSWGSELTEVGTLHVTKVGGSGQPLSGAEFTLTGSDGSSRTATTNDKGTIFWTGLDPLVIYTLTETKAPAGYGVVNPMKLTVKAAQINYVTVKDDPQKTLTVHKIDKQNGYSLQGAVIRFEQIDGTFKTTKITDHAGNIQMNGEQLPFGSYKVYEVTAPEGYEVDGTARTIHWDGSEDMTLVFSNVRKPTLIISKQDSRTHIGLANATFVVSRNGQVVTTVTTNDDGLAYVPGLTSGYYEVMETAAPNGYALNSKTYGINIDPYHPATSDDPRLVVTNDPLPSLRIVKYDRETGKPLADTTFKVYRDTVEIGTYTTDRFGEILLTGLEPGTYTVEEVAAPDSHVVNSTPQSIELVAGQTNEAVLIFFNSLKPGIHLVKVDSETLKPLPNATYLISKVGGTFSKEYVTDKDGEIDLSKLEPGAYTVKEVKAPEGYLIDDGIRTVQLNAGGNAQFVFTDTPKPSLTVVKYDPNTGKFLPGATFKISKVEDGSHYLDRVTDTQGRITIDKLEPGVYSVQETGAPEGYILNDTEYHVELFPGKNSELVVVNEAKPDLRIVKTDAISGKPVQGVTFTVRMADGQTITTEATDENGEIFLTDMEPGVVEIWEQSVPGTYLLNEEHQFITLTANRLGTVYFQNNPRLSLRIVKYDQQTKQPLADTTFQVYRNTVPFGTYTTDENGEILLTGLEPGTYTVEEVAAPDTHVANSSPQSIKLLAGRDEIVTLVFFNYLKPGIHLVKVDSETLEPLPNATYLISKVGGSFSKEYVTDENGEIDLSKLEPGTYTVKEVKAPMGYLIDDGIRTIQIKEGENAQFVFTDTPMPSLTVVKYDPVKNAYLAGATFRIAKVEDGSHYLDRVTDTQGRITIYKLDPGVYSVQELSAPTGYVLNSTEYHVELFPGKNSELVVINEAKPDLRIVKTDAITGEPVRGVTFTVKLADGRTITTEATDEKGEIFLADMEPGVVEIWEQSVPNNYLLNEEHQLVTLTPNKLSTVYFQNYPKPGLVINKVDSVTGDPIKGAKFHITYASNNTFTGSINDLGNYMTDEDGRITLAGLTDGWYRITEIEAAAGYSLKEPVTQDVYIKAGTTKELTFENTPLSALVVWKYDSVTGEAVAGTVFQVRYLSGTSGSGGTIIGTYKTSANGSFTVTGLKAGTYIVEELASDSGHVIDTAPQTVYISGEEQSVVEIYFGNSPKGGLLVKKVDAVTGKPLSDVEFMVTDSTGAVVGDANGKFITDSAGSFTVNGITPGTTLVVKETRAKAGYILDDAPQTAQIKAGQTVTMEFRNTPTPKGALRIVKLDEETRQPISGVEFLVTHINGARLGTYRTNSRGIIVLDDLTPGWYTVTETKAGKGYNLDTQPHDIQVKDGQTATLEVTNRLTSSALIHKVDSVTGKGIYGVTFLVCDGKGNPVGQYTTDQNGYIYINGELDDGKYTIREIQATEGYLPDTTVKTFYVEYGATTTITWKNTPITGQIQITKTSADYNSINGWAAGTPIPGTEFEVYNRAGVLVDTIRTDKNGIAVTKALPLGRYTLVESKAADNYLLDKTPIEVEIEFAGQIVRAAMTNKSVQTGVSITKTGYAEVMPGQQLRYILSGIANTSNVPLDSFYWRDTLPVEAVRLSQIITGTWNTQGSYKIVYRTNLSGGEYRTLADNLSTQRNYLLDASPMALRLASNEYVTEIMAVFGVVPAGFRQVETPKVDCTVLPGLVNGAQFVNQADAGGVYNSQWVQAVSRWTTKVYAPTKTLPRTGY